MPFLQINNYTIPTESCDASEKLIGAQILTQAGSLASSVVKIQKTLAVNTSFVDAATARALTVLLAGKGDVWSFDDATYFQYSAKGAGLVVGSGLTRGTTTPNPVYGAAYGMVNSAAYAEMDIALDSTTGWTCMFWHNPTQTAAGTWTHYAVTSAGNHYANGVFSALAAQYLLTTSNNRPRINGKNTANTNTASSYDDLVVIPTALPAAMIAAFYADTAAFYPLPSLAVKGDAIAEMMGNNGSATMYGDIGSIRSTAENVAGSQQYTLQFDLVQE